MSSSKKRVAYLYLSVIFVAAYLFAVAFTNITTMKVYFFNRSNSEKYFNEIESLNVKGKDISNEMYLSLEAPERVPLVNGQFTIEGWAIDESKVPGAKIDYVGVYLGGAHGDGGLPLSRCDYGIYRRDVGKIKGSEFNNSGFYCTLDSNRIEDGLVKLYIYFHSNKFAWKYDTFEIFVNNNNTFYFEDVLDIQNKDKNLVL